MEKIVNQYPGKLIILDFWDRHCQGCINDFPRLNLIQDSLGNQIQILLITGDEKEDLKGLLKNSRIFQNNKLPIIFGDSVLHQTFPHSAIPYDVWIDKYNNVVATADGESATIGNISTYLKTGKIVFPQRIDPTLDRTRIDAALIDQIGMPGMGQREQVRAYSLIMGRSKISIQENSGILFDSGKIVGLREINLPVIVLISLTYDYRDYDRILAPGFYEPENPDSVSYWKHKNEYCYEQQLSPEDINLPNSVKMQIAKSRERRDIEVYFNIYSSIEKRKHRCLTIYQLPGFNMAKSAGGESLAEPVDRKQNRWIYQNADFVSLILDLQYTFDHAPGMDGPLIINETGIGFPVDMDIRFTDDIDFLKSEFAKYHLGIRDEMKEINCLIIGQKNNP
jgi:hypothetical protein